ncbi:hypothetical protein COOONC_03988 [Cooperia oncophora]
MAHIKRNSHSTIRKIAIGMKVVQIHRLYSMIFHRNRLSLQWAARAAVDNLFEQREVFSAKVSQQASTLPKPINNAAGDNNIQTKEAVVEFINNKKADFKLEVESSPLHAGGPSAASVISECSVSSLPSDAHRLDLDYSRLKAEHRKLQRHLEAVRHDRYRAPDVKEAVRRLLKGDPVSLEWYRSKEEKIQLLDAAIDIIDGNVILAVQALKKCVRSGFSDPTLGAETAVVTDYISLLERQMPINAADDQSKNTIFSAFPKNASLVGKPVIATYYYCCLYHYDDPMVSFPICFILLSCSVYNFC